MAQLQTQKATPHEAYFKKSSETMKMEKKVLLTTICLGLLKPLVADSMARRADYQTLYPMLGKNSLDELSYEYEISIDDDCHYEFKVTWRHSPQFPVGGADTCLPSVLADYDGNSMLEGRWFYEQYPEYVRDATDIDHLSLDWNPCGHPTAGFLVPHYDLHFYRVSPDFRVNDMNCEVIPGTPACWPDQFTDDGQKFFKVKTSSDGSLVNMPKNYEINPQDSVIYMGSHALDPSTVPENPSVWSEPAYVLLTHDANIICVEPMLPFQYAIGEQDQSYEKELSYVDQSDETLPYWLAAAYDASTGTTSATLKGKSKMCKAEFEAAREAFKTSQEFTSRAGRHDWQAGLAYMGIIALASMLAY